MQPFCHLLLIVTAFCLKSLVPSPGGMGTPYSPDQHISMPGARVVPPVSGENKNYTTIPDRVAYRAKPHEAWALSGLGPVSSRTRCTRIKRAFTRACFRALNHGVAMYRNRPLYSSQVPFRIRQKWHQSLI